MDKEKAVGLFRLSLNKVFIPFQGYGQAVFIPETVDQIVKLALLLNERLKEKDV